jgi:hypothetical protein
MLSPEVLLTIAECYLDPAASGDNLLLLRSDLSNDILASYLRLASLWLQSKCQLSLLLYSDCSGTKLMEALHPYMSKILGQRRNWKKA